MSGQDSEMRLVDDSEVDASGQFAPSSLFSEKERRVLELYDRLQELVLETALLTARGAHKPSKLLPN